jgi:hypothetical protein
MHRVALHGVGGDGNRRDILWERRTQHHWGYVPSSPRLSISASGSSWTPPPDGYEGCGPQ